MNIDESTIVKLFETQCLGVSDIIAAIDAPEAFVIDVLTRKSPRYRTMIELKDDPETLDVAATEDDISDDQFRRIRQEAYMLATDHDNSEFVRASMLKFMWNKKRPETSININQINVTQINQALEKAKQIRQEKLKHIDV